MGWRGTEVKCGDVIGLGGHNHSAGPRVPGDAVLAGSRCYQTRVLLRRWQRALLTLASSRFGICALPREFGFEIQNGGTTEGWR